MISGRALHQTTRQRPPAAASAASVIVDNETVDSLSRSANTADPWFASIPLWLSDDDSNDDGDNDGQTSSGGGQLYCPECVLPLTGKIAALRPCGHIVHASCAAFLANSSKLIGARCAQCKQQATGSQVLHGGADDPLPVPPSGAKVATTDPSSSTTAPTRPTLTATLQRVAGLQAAIGAEDLRHRRAARVVQHLQQQCAAGHQRTSRLRRSLETLQAAGGGGSTGSSATTLASVSGGGGAAASAARLAGPPAQVLLAANGAPAAFAHDPLVSVARLQQYIRDGIAADAVLRERAAATERAADEATATIQACKDEREALLRELTEARRALRRVKRERRESLADASMLHGGQRRQPAAADCEMGTARHSSSALTAGKKELLSITTPVPPPCGADIPVNFPTATAAVAATAPPPRRKPQRVFVVESSSSRSDSDGDDESIVEVDAAGRAVISLDQETDSGCDDEGSKESGIAVVDHPSPGDVAIKSGVAVGQHLTTSSLAQDSFRRYPRSVADVGNAFKNVGRRFGEIPQPRRNQRTLDDYTTDSFANGHSAASS